jgi:prophage regulatory protein
VNTAQLRLVGAHEIRDMMGCCRQRVYRLTGRDDFPAPAARLAQGTVWLADEVEEWITNRRKPTVVAAN